MTPLILSILYRLRGSDVLKGTQLKRLLFWCLPCGLVLLPCGLIPAAAGFIGAFLGMLIPHGWAFGDKKPWHLVGMSVIGMIRLGLVLSGVIYQHPIVALLIPFGAFMGLASYIGWTYFNGVKSGIVINGTDLLQDNTAWQEVFTGLLAYGLPLTVTVLLCH